MGNVVDERIYLGDYEIYRRSTQAGVQLERHSVHLSDGRVRIALIETTIVEDGVVLQNPRMRQRFQLADHVNSTCTELDRNAQIISYEEYYPYGGTAYEASNSAVDVSHKRFRYSGKERDEESGLHYFGARYYAAWLGRWTAADPERDPRRTNLFQFSESDPINFGDPDGRAAWVIPVLIYLAWRGAESAAETGIEAGIADYTDDESFSPGISFVKNMGVNSVVGLVPGAVEAKLSTKALLYGGKLAVRTTGDTVADTLQGRGDFSENVGTNLLANVGGDAAGGLLKRGFDKLKNLTGFGGDVVSSSAKATVQRGAAYSAERVTRSAGKHFFEAAEILAAFAKVKDLTPTAREVFDALKAGRIKLEFLGNDALQGKGGSILDRTTGLINQTQSLEDILASIVHEGRHLLDIQAGIIPEVAGATGEAVRLFAEARAWKEEIDFVLKAGFAGADASKFVGLRPYDVLQSLLNSRSYNFGNIELYEFSDVLRKVWPDG